MIGCQLKSGEKERETERWHTQYGSAPRHMALTGYPPTLLCFSLCPSLAACRLKSHTSSRDLRLVHKQHSVIEKKFVWWKQHHINRMDTK